MKSTSGNSVTVQWGTMLNWDHSYPTPLLVGNTITVLGAITTMSTAQTELTGDRWDGPELPPAESIATITGVRDLRSALEWYRRGHGRAGSDDAMPIAISGVWKLICGRADGSVLDDNQIETLDEKITPLVDNREQFVANHDEITPDDIDRVIGLLRGLQEVDREYRVYGEDREKTCSIDIRTRCFVGLYHVTDATTLVTYSHISQGYGAVAYTNRGVEAPRKDIEAKLRDDVFYDKYDYVRLDEPADDTAASGKDGE
jgi:hypothetical protein